MFDCQQIIIFDLEWTSWLGFMESGRDQPGRDPEIIQMGAVALSVDDKFREIDSFQVLVQPKKHPVLSDYIIKLTGITQAMVDAEGHTFPEAFNAFMNFAGPEPIQFGCFGEDEKILEINCGFYGLEMPASFTSCVNVHKEFMNLGIIGEDCNSSDLPICLGLPPVGEAHNALADSRAISAALRHMGDKLI